MLVRLGEGWLKAPRRIRPRSSRFRAFVPGALAAALGVPVNAADVLTTYPIGNGTQISAVFQPSVGWVRGVEASSNKLIYYLPGLSQGAACAVLFEPLSHQPARAESDYAFFEATWNRFLASSRTPLLRQGPESWGPGSGGTTWFMRAAEFIGRNGQPDTWLLYVGAGVRARQLALHNCTDPAVNLRAAPQAIEALKGLSIVEQQARGSGPNTGRSGGPPFDSMAEAMRWCSSQCVGTIAQFDCVNSCTVRNTRR